MWLPFSVLYVGMTLLVFLLSTDCWLVKLSNVTDFHPSDNARGHVTGVGVATSVVGMTLLVLFFWTDW